MSAAMAMKTSPSRAKLTEVGSRVRQGERRPGNATKSIEVATTRRVHHLGGQRRRRSLAIPSARPPPGVPIIPQLLLVEAGLCAARLLFLRGPEAGGDGGGDLRAPPG